MHAQQLKDKKIKKETAALDPSSAQAKIFPACLSQPGFA
jgi:hypothetical protein